MTFKSILQKQLETLESPSSARLRPLPLDLAPLHMAFLMGIIPKHSPPSGTLSIKTNTIYSSLKMNNSPKTTIVAEESVNLTATSGPRVKSEMVAEPLTPPSPPEDFNIDEKQAWLWFWMRGSPLSGDFTDKELQRAYRKLAHDLHPDKNKSPRATEFFLQLRKHFNTLKSLLQSY